MPEPQPHPASPLFKDLTGKKFDKLIARFYAGKNAKGYSLWHCRCKCGGERTVVASELISGRAPSCQACAQLQRKKKDWRRLEFSPRRCK